MRDMAEPGSGSDRVPRAAPQLTMFHSTTEPRSGSDRVPRALLHYEDVPSNSTRLLSTPHLGPGRYRSLVL